MASVTEGVNISLVLKCFDDLTATLGTKARNIVPLNTWLTLYLSQAMIANAFCSFQRDPHLLYVCNFLVSMVKPP